MFTDNKIKSLKTDLNADFIFKKGDYLHTYIVIETSGIPNGEILYLLDENLNQLYSPYDVNGNEVKSSCFIVSGETDALQLPANYNGNLYVDFEEGTYNWNLKYHDAEETFTDVTIPITIEIRDFNIEENLTQEIYPNQDIQIKLRTYIDTPKSQNEFDTHRLTTNASYDESTGIITYPNSDIIDLSIGEHTQVINQTKNYHLNYTIKNPFKISYVNDSREYSTANQPILLQSFQTIYRESDNRPVHAVETYPTIYINGISPSVLINWSHSYGLGKEYAGTTFPPGTYNIEATAKYLPNHLYYTATKTMVVTTNNCTITLTRYENNIVATYMYNNETPIPNASIQMLEDSIVVDTLITDSNGQCSITGQYNSTYKAQAIDYDNSILLESNTFTMELEFITINITNVPSEYEWFIISFNGAPDDMKIINFTQSYMSYTLYPMNADRLTLENNILSINIDKYLWEKYTISYNTRNASLGAAWPTKYLYNLEDNDNDDIITVAFEDLPNQPNEG